MSKAIKHKRRQVHIKMHFVESFPLNGKKFMPEHTVAICADPAGGAGGLDNTIKIAKHMAS